MDARGEASFPIQPKRLNGSWFSPGFKSDGVGLGVVGNLGLEALDPSHSRIDPCGFDV